MNRIKVILILLVNIIPLLSNAQLFRNDFHSIGKENYLKSKESIKLYHPNPFSCINEEYFDRTVDSLSAYLPTDSILETEFIYWYRKAFDLLTYNDPHFRILPELRPREDVKIKSNDVFVLPFSLICINDTLIVDKSINKAIQKGDRIISIDKISAEELLKYTYKDRYTNTVLMQAQYHYHFNKEYKLCIVRQNKEKQLLVEGVKLSSYNKHLIFRGVDFKVENDIGYIRFDQFAYNGHIIKCFNKLIDKAIKTGVNDIIVDIRRNPGGSGEDFDKLMSIMINKSKVNYLSSSKLRYSTMTEDYNFNADSLGKTIFLPDSLFHKEFPLNTSLYRGKLNYYVLVSSNTGSMASTFANLIQYNEAGLLVGEPLKKNALRFGEVEIANLKKSSAVTISTLEYEEHTKAKDGILYPNIKIPFVAREYMKGGDPVLEKLTIHIRKSKVANNGL